jgi:hypothetical protein
MPEGNKGLLTDLVLSLTAETLEHTERALIANQNRLRQYTRTEADSDGRVRGWGLTLAAPQVQRLVGLIDAQQQVHDNMVLFLQQLMRAHPLWPWASQIVGVGEKQFARLLGALHDPYWNERDNRPRTVAELWAYTGFDTDENGIARRRKRGERNGWNDTAKMRVRLIADSSIKWTGEDDKNGRHRPRSQFRDVYERVREQQLTTVHTQPCIQCGTRGKPAVPGTPLRDGHQHGRAMRAVCKEFLKLLWRESKHLHEAAAQQVAA